MTCIADWEARVLTQKRLVFLTEACRLYAVAYFAAAGLRQPRGSGRPMIWLSLTPHTSRDLTSATANPP